MSKSNPHHIELADSAESESPELTPAEQLDAALKPAIAAALADITARLDHLAVTSADLMRPPAGVALAQAISMLSKAVREHYGLTPVGHDVAASCAQPERAQRPRMNATGNVFLPADDERHAGDGRDFTRSVFGWFIDDFVITELNNAEDGLLGVIALVEAAGDEPAFISGKQMGALLRALADPFDHLKGMMPGMWARESDIPSLRSH